MLPVIALVGRPNVGKSTLFNRLTRTRDALVADRPGLTRDRQYGVGRLGSRPYVVVDTGGISVDQLGVDALMQRQVQRAIDEALLELDGTENKASLGANAMLAVSLAVAKAAAASRGEALYAHIASIAGTGYSMPVPMMNILNGGEHADNNVDIQEFMVVPVGVGRGNVEISCKYQMLVAFEAFAEPLMYGFQPAQFPSERLRKCIGAPGG